MGEHTGEPDWSGVTVNYIHHVKGCSVASGVMVFYRIIVLDCSWRVGKAPGDLQEKCPLILLPVLLHVAELWPKNLRNVSNSPDKDPDEHRS